MKWYTTGSNGQFTQQPGKLSVKLDGESLVHHFEKLTGGKVTKGGIPAADMKVIRQVVAAGKDAVANAGGSCGACTKDIPGAAFVQCAACDTWWHAQCVTATVLSNEKDSVPSDEEDLWFCNDCMATT